MIMDEPADSDMVSEETKKGLLYAALGFMFVLVNINLQFDAKSVNITPDFIGFILLYLSLGYLGNYAADKGYLKWTAMILALCSAALWIFGLVSDADVSVIRSLVSLVNAFFMFVYLGIIAQIAYDHQSVRADTLNMLRYVSAGVEVFLAVLSMTVSRFMIVDGRMNPAGVVLILFGGLVGLAAAVWTMFTLFGVRKEIAQM